MSQLRSIVNLLVLSAFTAIVATSHLNAQQQAKALTLASFNEESVIPPSQMFAPNAPSLPDAVVSAINGGGFELHQQVMYDSAKSSLSISGFVTPSGSPVPTVDMSYTTAVYNFQISVSQLTATESAITFTGAVTAAVENGQSVDASSSLATVAAGFTLGSPDASGVAQAVISSASVAITGVGSLTATSGAAAVKILDHGSQLPIAVAGPKGQQFLTPTFQLSAAGSRDPATGGLLSYRWVFLPGNNGQSVTLLNETSATPTVTINDAINGQGDYKFQLVVTNAAGASAIDTVTVTYLLPDPQSE